LPGRSSKCGATLVFVVRGKRLPVKTRVAAMPSIAVVFELDQATTHPGESIFVVGSHPGMGSWNPTGAGHQDRQLSTSPLTYPRWIMASPLWLDDESADGLEISYKYVKMTLSQRLEWETGPDRRIELRAVPRGSDVWIVKDHSWGPNDRALNVFPCSLAELISSRCEVDPNWRPVVPQARRPAPVIPALSLTKVLGDGRYEFNAAGGEFSSDDDSSEDSGFRTPDDCQTARARQEAASRILRELEAAAAANRPAELDVEAQLAAFRRENAALRAVLRCLAAGEVKVSSGDRRKQRQVIMRTASLVPEEVWAFAFDSPETTARNRRLSHGAEVLQERSAELCASAQTTVEGLFWDWPLSRSERKQRLLLAESRLQALEGQELLQEIVQENALERQELSEVTQVLKEQIAKLRGKGQADWYQAPRGGG